MKSTWDFEVGQVVREKFSSYVGTILMICDANHLPRVHLHVDFGEYRSCVLADDLEAVFAPRYIIDLWIRRSPVVAST